MRTAFLALLALLATTMVFPIGAVGAAAAAPDAARLPDLRQVAPDGMEVRRAPGGRTVLAFISAVENVGPGALIVRGIRRAGGDTMRADQILQRADGSQVVRRDIGTIWFLPGGHNHWHFASFQRFELRDPLTGRRVARDHKTGFCLGDRFPTNPTVPGASSSPVINHNCSRGRPGANRITMGITPGWGDDYKAYLEDQFVDITRLPPGRYVVVHRADPQRVLAVGSRADDVATSLVDLGRPGKGGLPSVRLLARCPGRDGSPARPCSV